MQQGEEPLLALGSLHRVLRGSPGAQRRPFCSPSKSTPESSQSKRKVAQPATSGFFCAAVVVFSATRRDARRAAHRSDFSTPQLHAAFSSGCLRAQLGLLPFDLRLEGVGLVGGERLRWGDYFTFFFSSSCWEALHGSTKLCRGKATGKTSVWEPEPL